MERDTRYLEHFDPHAPELRTEFWDALDMMRRERPVAHSDQHGGFWVVTKYPDVARVLRRPRDVPFRRWGHGAPEPGAVPLPPIETDPPEQREWRHILNPYFTPAVIKSHADGIRAIANEIIDDFIERGEVDLQMGFAHHFPGTVFFREVLGIDGDDLLNVLALTHTISFDNASEAAAVAFQELGAFCAKVLQQRAVEQPRAHDVVRALIEGTIGGEPIPLDRQAATLDDDRHWRARHQLDAPRKHRASPVQRPGLGRLAPGRSAPRRRRHRGVPPALPERHRARPARGPRR